MIKVEHTIPYPTDKATIGGIVGWTSVADAELVLAPTKEIYTASEQQILKTSSGLYIGLVPHMPGVVYKPILISKTEKIEDGDWGYNKTHGLVKVTNLLWVRQEGLSKVLALPEDFSPETLKDIVDGKLKEGKCMVECEIHDEWLKENPPFDNDKEKAYYQIKLNPHITIYPVEEEKMYSREEVAKLLGKFCIDGEISKTPFSDAWINKWFEQNVK